MLLTRPGKIKAMSGRYTVSFGIPAFKSSTGRVTCPGASRCSKFCYARKGHYRFKNTKSYLETALAVSMTDSFADLICDEIARRKSIMRVRIHHSGDFYSKKYAEKWIDIIDRNPGIHFYSYTKSIPIIRSLDLPENFTEIYSYGGRFDKLIDPEIDRHCQIFDERSVLRSMGYADASKDDAKALGKNHRIGLLRH